MAGPAPGNGVPEVVRLKECVWRRQGTSLVVMFDPTRTVRLADPGGQVEHLLTALATGPRAVHAVQRELVSRSVIGPADTLDDALTVLDRLGLVEGVSGQELPTTIDRDRHISNLAFFSSFSSLATGREEFLRRLRAAHVLQLGVGGIGSTVVQTLCGLGVGRFTLLDDDRISMANLNRQVLYRHADVGTNKTERAAAWVRAWDPTIEVATVQRRVTVPADVVDLLDGVDVVVASIDEPPEVGLAVNAATTPRGVPLVRGGVSPFGLLFSSVAPGTSACLACIHRAMRESQPAERRSVEHDLVARLPRPNGSTAPMVAMAGALISLEVARFITGFQAPHAAGANVRLDLRDNMAFHVDRFERAPSCAVCGDGPAGGD